MNLANLRSITNDYLAVRLISLRAWAQAREIEPRDQGGPYVVAQDGYDPEDLRMSYDEFVLGRSGVWLSVGLFMKLPREARREEFVFGTAAEVIALMEGLGGKVKIVRKGDELSAEDKAEDDDLLSAFQEEQQKAKSDQS